MLSVGIRHAAEQVAWIYAARSGIRQNLHDVLDEFCQNWVTHSVCSAVALSPITLREATDLRTYLQCATCKMTISDHQLNTRLFI